MNTVPWWHPHLIKISALVLKDEGDFWHVVECTGQMTEKQVSVRLPFQFLDKDMAIQGQIIEMARLDKVFAKGLGLFNYGVIRYQTPGRTRRRNNGHEAQSHNEGSDQAVEANP